MHSATVTAPDTYRGTGRVYSGLALPGVLVLALGLRAWGLSEQSLTMDEVAELGIAAAKPNDIVGMADGFPPLFALLLHWWLGLFGTDAAARWLAVLLGCVSVMPVAALGRRAGGERAGLFAALLIAVSPFHIWHSQEGRAYILYFLLAALCLAALYRALASGRDRDWVGYAVAGIGGMFTHYYFGFILIINALIVVLERPDRARLRGLAVAHLVLTVGVLPLFVVGTADFASEAGTPFAAPFQASAIPYSYFAFLAGYSIGPSIADLHTMGAVQAASHLAGWLVAIGAAVAVLGYQGVRTIGPMWTRRMGLLALLPVVVCIPLAGLLSITYQVRHLVWVLIPITIVLGAGAARRPFRWPASAALVCLGAVFVTALYHRRYEPRYANEDLRALAAYLRVESTENLPTFVMTGYMARPLKYYLEPDRSVYPLPSVGRDGESLERALAYVKERVAPGSSFWFVYVRPFHGDRTGRFRESLLRGSRAARVAAFSGIELYRVMR